MDIAQAEAAEAQLNGFLDRQASKVKEDRAGQQRANEQEATLRAADERRTAQLHKENRVLWREHFIRMARNHHDLAAEYAAKADELNGDDAA